MWGGGWSGMLRARRLLMRAEDAGEGELETGALYS